MRPRQYLREKVVPLAGDVSRVRNVGLSDAEVARLTKDGPLDVILNSAGLVSFNPSLESALRINVYGVKYVMDLGARDWGQRGACLDLLCGGTARRRGLGRRAADWLLPAATRTCAVGIRRARRCAGDFDVHAEIADCERLIEQTRQRAEDRAHLSMFREKGAERLRPRGATPTMTSGTCEAAVQREKQVPGRQSA
jgi:long-chain acyl-CoA synthetase